MLDNPMNQPSEQSRRRFLFKVALLINGAVGAVVAVPILGYILGPILKQSKSYNYWIPLGLLTQFPEGETRLAHYHNPDGSPADGQTRTLPCWVRHLKGTEFQVFAINCAHMGCPVHWFPQSKLFMCPCHGGVYYQDGARAAGPPPRGLFKYQYKIVGDKLMIRAGEMPTLATEASIAAPGSSPCQG